MSESRSNLGVGLLALIPIAAFVLIVAVAALVLERERSKER